MTSRYYTDTPYQTNNGMIVSLEHDQCVKPVRESCDFLGKLALKGGRNVMSFEEHDTFATSLLVAWQKGMSPEETQDFAHNHGHYYELSEIRTEFA